MLHRDRGLVLLPRRPALVAVAAVVAAASVTVSNAAIVTVRGPACHAPQEIVPSVAVATAPGVTAAVVLVGPAAVRIRAHPCVEGVAAPDDGVRRWASNRRRGTAYHLVARSGLPTVVSQRVTGGLLTGVAATKGEALSCARYRCS